MHLSLISYGQTCLKTLPVHGFPKKLKEKAANHSQMRKFHQSTTCLTTSYPNNFSPCRHITHKFKGSGIRAFFLSFATFLLMPYTLVVIRPIRDTRLYTLRAKLKKQIHYVFKICYHKCIQILEMFDNVDLFKAVTFL